MRPGLRDLLYGGGFLGEHFADAFDLGAYGAGGMLVCVARGGLEIVCGGRMHGGAGI
jgi:hypothetical protein